MSVTMHELADRLRAHDGRKAHAILEVRLDGIGLVASATLIQRDGNRTKIV